MPYSYEEGRYIHSFPELPEFAIERNLLTFAASRSGKGVTQIIPFLRDNPTTNALVIDPKGEAAEATAAHRAEAGQNVHVLDPMKTARLPDGRARLNFLDEIDPSKPSAFRQINALADGLIMRHDPKGGHWDGGGMQVLAGFIAHVLTAPEFEGKRSLITVRKLLLAENDDFTELLYDMAQNTACGGLPIAASDKLLNTGNEAGHFRSVASQNTAWLDDPDICECLSDSTFCLSDLKQNNTDVFLVLPFDALDNYGVFLRLFVRMAMYHMQQKLPNGELKGQECYFILDEFFSLGHLEPIEKGMGAMPGYNLRLWPFLQDYTQLAKLYGQMGTGTFFSNSDAVYFFGTNDIETARIVSTACGQITESDIGVKPPKNPEPENPDLWPMAIKPPVSPAYTKDLEAWQNMRFQESSDLHNKSKARLQWAEQIKATEYTDALDQYHHARATIGHARVSPEQVMEITKRNPERKIAEQAIVIREGAGYLIQLKASFETDREREIEELNAIRVTPDPKDTASLKRYMARKVKRENDANPMYAFSHTEYGRKIINECARLFQKQDGEKTWSGEKKRIGIAMWNAAYVHITPTREDWEAAEKIVKQSKWGGLGKLFY